MDATTGTTNTQRIVAIIIASTIAVLAIVAAFIPEARTYATGIISGLLAAVSGVIK